MVSKILRLVDDNPYADSTSTALTATAGTVQITLTSDVTARYQVGGQIDWVDDGTFESAVIISIDSTTQMTIRRGERGSTPAIHVANAVFRYLGRWVPFTLSETIDDMILALWPELYDVV